MSAGVWSPSAPLSLARRRRVRVFMASGFLSAHFSLDRATFSGLSFAHFATTAARSSGFSFAHFALATLAAGLFSYRRLLVAAALSLFSEYQAAELALNFSGSFKYIRALLTLTHCRQTPSVVRLSSTCPFLHGMPVKNDFSPAARACSREITSDATSPISPQPRGRQAMRSCSCQTAGRGMSPGSGRSR